MVLIDEMFFILFCCRVNGDVALAAFRLWSRAYAVDLCLCDVTGRLAQSK